MKGRKIRFISSLLACALLLLIFPFVIKPKAQTVSTESAELVGQDSEKMYNLSISLKVFYDAEGDNYSVSARAEWKRAGIFTKSKKCAENKYDDRIIFSWGGDGALCADEESVCGEYRNGKKAEFLKTQQSNSFVWQFKEKSKRSQMSFANVSFSLKKEGISSGGQTGVRMTYVHTYKQVKATVPVIFGVGSAPDKIIFSEYENVWQIEIDVPGINY